MFKRARTKKTGMTIIELVVSMVVLGILMVMAISGLNIKSSKGNSRGLAVEVKGLFDQARAQAISTGEPVGIVFPTSNGTTPIVQECAILKGADLGQLQRQLDFSGNYPGVGIFIGEWSVPAPGFTTPTVPTSEEAARFNPVTWLPVGLKQQSAFIFLPSGGLIANSGQKYVNFEFPLVISDQMTATSGSAGFGTLSLATDAYTVKVSTNSITSLQKGVLGDLVGSGGTDSSAWTLASLTLPSTGNTATPQITSVKVEPAPIDPAFAAAANAECIIEPGGLVTLQVKATDADGGPLFCSWTDTTGLGQFSHQAESPMLYLPEDDAWVSTWHWKAPPNATPGDIFPLTVSVRDQSLTANVGAGIVSTPRILVVDEGMVVFSTALNFSSSTEKCHAYSVKFDGTDLKAIYESFSTAGMGGGMNPSRDGRRVALGDDYVDNEMKLISMDGAEVKRIPSTASNNFPIFSADGSRVYVSRGLPSNPGAWTEVEISFDSAGNPIENPSPYPGRVVAWSPNGSQALIKNGHSLDIYNLDGTLAQSGIAPTNSQGLDWNVSGIFYAANSTTTAFFSPGVVDIFRIPPPSSPPWPSVASHINLGNYPQASDIGGNGQFIIYAGQGIIRKNIATGVTRVIHPSFVRPVAGGFEYGNFGHTDMATFTAYLFSSK